MKHLVLFLTQGEAGAPGYLSSLGEDGALSLAEQLKRFVGHLGIPLEIGSAERAQALEALQNRGGRNDASVTQTPALGTEQANVMLSFEEGLATALQLYPHLLICCGTSVRSRKTLAPFVEHLALPVVLLEGLDLAEPRANEPVSMPLRHNPRAIHNNLGAGLARLWSGSSLNQGSGLAPSSTDRVSAPTLPTLIVVQTSLAAFGQWLPTAPSSAAPESVQAMIAALEQVSEGDRIPALAALGFEASSDRPWPGRWLLDETVESH